MLTFQPICYLITITLKYTKIKIKLELSRKFEFPQAIFVEKDTSTSCDIFLYLPCK